MVAAVRPARLIDEQRRFITIPTPGWRPGDQSVSGELDREI
jgi:hypothetical protein